MEIHFDNWAISMTQGSQIAQFDNGCHTIRITGNIPEGYSWDLLMQSLHTDHMNIVSLSAFEGGLSATLSANDLSDSGCYNLQLRGTTSAATSVRRHTNVIDFFVSHSLSGDINWPVLPTEFSQMEARIQSVASHPPIPDENGYWQVWNADTSAYQSTTLPVGIQGLQGLPGEKGDTGAQGAPGATGKSAYAAAHESGYSGTEAQFNAALSQVGNAVTYKGAISKNTDLSTLDPGFYRVDGVSNATFPDPSKTYYGGLLVFDGIYKGQLLCAGASGVGGVYARRYLTGASAWTEWITPYQKPSGGIPNSDIASASVWNAKQDALTAGDNIDITNNVIKTKSFPCNPNLLDNGWFTVNQRGETSYTGAVQYTVDRWKTTNANTSVYCLDSGIRIVNNTSGSAGYLLQVIDDYRQLLGRTVTYSVMLGDGRVISASAAMPSVAPTETTTVITLYDGGISIGDLMFYKTSTAVPLWARIWSNANENERAFVAVKLELGSQQTLAHQESGVWVLNEIPNYGEELRKCRRYFWRLDTQEHWWRASYIGPNMVYFILSSPNMVRTPTIGSGTIVVRSFSTKQVESGFTFTPAIGTDGSLQITAYKESHGLTDAILEINGLRLSAEL